MKIPKEGDLLYITPSSYKKKLLQELSKEHKFYHIQFLTKEELKKQLLYEYHPKALWKLCNQFHLIPEIGAILLEAMYPIEKREQNPSLYDQKIWLQEQKLIITHPAFLESLTRKKIIIYGYDHYEMSFLHSVLKKGYDITYLKEEFKEYIPSITEYDTLEQEVVGVAEKITQLLQKNIPIDQIYLGSVNNDYKSVLGKIFHQFHIPLQQKTSHFLFEYQMVQDFLKKIPLNEPIDKIHLLFSELEHSYSTTVPFYQAIYESLTSILNQYNEEGILFDDIKEMLIYDLKRTKMPSQNYKNVVKEIDFKNTLLKESDYVFLMGINQGIFPTIYEDQDYFSDQEKSRLGLPTSTEATKGEQQKIIQKIKSLPHISLSYKKKTPFEEYLPASFLEEWKEHIKKGRYQYSNQSYNEYLLNSSLDQLIHFNEKNEHLKNRYGIETIFYQNYHNQFTTIRPSLFQKKVPSCVLSYTAMQKFFECPFKYYVGSILKITPPTTETTSLMIGNLFHSILEKALQNPKKEKEIIQEELDKVTMLPKNKRQFYINKYQNEITHLIALIKNQEARSSFRPKYFEKIIQWSEKKQITFQIFGKLDKIMTDETHIIVIDYKTGAATSDLSKIIYGMNMQLILYLYFISKEKTFNHYQLGGAYIQSILVPIPIYKEGKTLKDKLWDQGKLNGITLKRVDVIKQLDHQYATSSYIKGIRIKNDGDFYRSNHVIDSSTLDQLLEIAKEKIEEMEVAIENADFKIEPKRFSNEIGEQVSSCTYCPYQDICYRKPKNIMRLKEVKSTKEEE